MRYARRRTYRRRSTKARRPYRKRPNRTYKVAKRAAKRVINSMAEKKFIRQNVSGSIPNSGYFYPIFDGLPQGTTVNTRTGSEIRAKHWYFKGYIDFSPTTTTTTVRVIMVTAKNEGDPVSLSDMPAGSSAPYFPLMTNIVKVMKDFTISYTPGVNTARRSFGLKLKYPLGKRIRYDNNSSSVAQGQVFLYLVSDKITPDGMPFLYGFHSMSFIDM